MSPRRVAIAAVLCITASLGCFSMPVSAASPIGGRCGGFAGFRCEPGLACRLPGRGADRMGICVRAGGARGCHHNFAPVCGRDGRTYSNACVMRANGVELQHHGRC